MSRIISAPAGADIRLASMGRHHVVMVAPPPLKAELNAFLRPGVVSGLFTFDPGMTWPDRDGCAFAQQYLKLGVPVCFQFGSMADALTCHSRLLREAGR